MEPRKCFTFFLSFYTAICELPDDQQLEMYRAVAEYALFGAEPQLAGTLNALFSLMRPNIDSSNRKRDNGKKGGDVGAGGAPIGNRNAAKVNSAKCQEVHYREDAIDMPVSKTIANQKQNDSDIEIEEEIEKEKETDINPTDGRMEEKEGMGEKETALSPADAFLLRHKDDADSDFVMLCYNSMKERERAAYFS